MENAVLMEKHKGKRTLEKSRLRCRNIKMNFQEMKLGSLDWIDLVQVMDK
jgi:hypothetical protein